MEDDLKKMEDNLKKNKNGGQPQFFGKSKKTIIFDIGRRPQFSRRIGCDTIVNSPSLSQLCVTFSKCNSNRPCTCLCQQNIKGINNLKYEYDISQFYSAISMFWYLICIIIMMKKEEGK